MSDGYAGMPDFIKMSESGLLEHGRRSEMPAVHSLNTPSECLWRKTLLFICVNARADGGGKGIYGLIL